MIGISQNEVKTHGMETSRGNRGWVRKSLDATGPEKGCGVRGRKFSHVRKQPDDPGHWLPCCPYRMSEPPVLGTQAKTEF
jgi:hypothetical protein